jgi:hypothetical protein
MGGDQPQYLVVEAQQVSNFIETHIHSTSITDSNNYLYTLQNSQTDIKSNVTIKWMAIT